MRKALYQKLACPYDKAAPLELTVFRDVGDDVLQGLLECSSCGRYYPIIGSVPVLLPDEFRDPSLEAPFLAKWQSRLHGRYGLGSGFRLRVSGRNDGES
jgi:uncharacterized protein